MLAVHPEALYYSIDMKKTNDYLIVFLVIAFIAGIAMLAVGESISHIDSGPQHEKAMNYDELGKVVSGSFKSGSSN